MSYPWWGYQEQPSPIGVSKTGFAQEKLAEAVIAPFFTHATPELCHSLYLFMTKKRTIRMTEMLSPGWVHPRSSVVPFLQFSDFDIRISNFRPMRLHAFHSPENDRLLNG